MNENAPKELSLDARRYLVDVQSIYGEYRKVRAELRQYAGGMVWKQSKGREYLFRLRGRKGAGSSLGVRSKETEQIYDKFYERKNLLVERERGMREKLAEKRPFVRAAGLGRVPRDAANVMRVLDAEGLMDRTVTVLGTHALYAYEAMAGVQFDSGLLATGDVDLLFDARRRLRLCADLNEGGLIGVLKKADKSFEIAGKGHFRAVNANGFMVELIKPLPKDPMTIERTSLSGRDDDLVAAEVPRLWYLADSPSVAVTVVAEDGLPLQLRVPDPVDFALNKLWTSHREDREPVKARRDYEQAVAVARVCVDHLGRSFEPPAGRNFPAEIVNEMRDLFPAGDGMAEDLSEVPGFG